MASDVAIWWVGAIFIGVCVALGTATIVGGAAYLLGKQSDRFLDNAVTMAGNWRAARDIARWARDGRPAVPSQPISGFRPVPPPDGSGAYGAAAHPHASERERE